MRRKSGPGRSPDAICSVVGGVSFGIYDTFWGDVERRRRCFETCNGILYRHRALADTGGYIYSLRLGCWQSN